MRLSDARDCFIWLEISSDQSCCYLTDLVNIYTETLDHKQFKQKFDELNPDLEIDNIEDLLKDIVKVMGNEKNTSTSVNGDNDIDLKCDWSEDGIEYKFMFSLNKGSDQLFIKHVSTKLVNCLIRFSQREEVLLDAVRKKDLEIDDYEAGGAQLSRKSLRSGRFKAEEAFKSCPKSQINPFDFLSGVKFAQILLDSAPSPLGKKDHNGTNSANDEDVNKVEDKPVIKRNFEKPNFMKNAKAGNVKKTKLSKF